jgi:hypothetical protein
LSVSVAGVVSFDVCRKRSPIVYLVHLFSSEFHKGVYDQFYHAMCSFSLEYDGITFAVCKIFKQMAIRTNGQKFFHQRLMEFQKWELIIHFIIFSFPSPSPLSPWGEYPIWGEDSPKSILPEFGIRGMRNPTLYIHNFLSVGTQLSKFFNILPLLTNLYPLSLSSKSIYYPPLSLSPTYSLLSTSLYPLTVSTAVPPISPYPEGVSSLDFSLHFHFQVTSILQVENFESDDEIFGWFRNKLAKLSLPPTLCPTFFPTLP